MNKLFFASVGFFMASSACTASKSLDRSFLNHPSMNLRTQATIKPRSLLTGLDTISNSSSAGTCSTCLK